MSYTNPLQNASWKVNEAILWVENDDGLAAHLDYDFYNDLLKKKLSGKYNREKALKLLKEYYIPRIMHVQYNETGNKDLYGMTQSEKTMIADYLLTQLEEEGGIAFEHIPLNSIKAGEHILQRDISELSDYLNERRARCYRPPTGHRGRKTTAPKKHTQKKMLVNVRNMF